MYIHICMYISTYIYICSGGTSTSTGSTRWIPTAKIKEIQNEQKNKTQRTHKKCINSKTANYRKYRNKENTD